jgi:tetratricopeptide (TPR) repeat protein
LGAVYNLLDQLDDAIPALRRGIQLDSHRAEGFYNLGLVYRRKGQPDLAIQAYREALRINPHLVEAYHNLANLHMEKQQYRQAIAHYKKALELRPDWENAQRGLADAEAAFAAKQPSEPVSPVPKVAMTPPPAAKQVQRNLDRMVDPNAHGQLLTTLHKATIESENYGRHFQRIVEGEIEPALKELSSCLLYPNSSTTELDECVQKFEHALQSMRSAQRNLQTSIERIRTIGDRLFEA